MHGALRGWLAIGKAELRSSGRLTRTWLFVLAGVAAGFLGHVGLTVFHAFSSGQSPSLGLLRPRFVSGEGGTFLLRLFVVALVFLAFDVRVRDQRARIVDAIDSRPFGNLALLTGRCAALVLLAWLPMALLVCLCEMFGVAAEHLGLPFGERLDFDSTAALLLVDAPAMLMIWCALVFLLSVALQNRAVAATAALALLAAHWWALSVLPSHLLVAFSGTVGSTAMPSDMVPASATARDLTQRLGQLVLAVGFLIVAAVCHPRPDDVSPGRRLVVGSTLVATGATIIGLLAWLATEDLARRESWRSVHERRTGEPLPDVERVEGRVLVDPGVRLGLDLRYQLRAKDQPLTELVMTFNPSMRVVGLTVDGQVAQYSHRSGALDVELQETLRPGDGLTLGLRAEGVPAPDFGYLDSPIDVARLPGTSSRLRLLGSRVGVFTDEYVALMPGMHWLPTVGAAVPVDGRNTRGPDFFVLDLEVRTPKEWRVAGPGRREGTAGRFRFRPQAPLSAVALLAAQFERRTTDIQGVELELLSLANQRRNILLFADAFASLRDYAERVLREANSHGLPFPYGGLSIVTVPAELRAFGGGWRMASVQSLPGILLLREYGFPSSRFEMLFANHDRPSGDTRSQAVKTAALKRYFSNDISGGNLHAGAMRNLFSFQTRAVGEGALALSFVLDELVQRMLTASGDSYYSPFALAESGSSILARAFADASGAGGAVASNAKATAIGRTAVWERARETPLASLDPTVDPQTVLDVLWLKGPTLAQSILDACGDEVVGRTLAQLLNRYRGRTFTVEDFLSVASEQGMDLESAVGDWLHQTGLPGFSASVPSVARIRDRVDGSPQFQSRIHVRNAERTPGVIRLRALVHGSEGSRTVSRWTDPKLVGGGDSVEIGLVTARPPEELWLHPVLSLNRRPFRVHTPRARVYVHSSDRPFRGSRPSDWVPPAMPGVVVDDLDSGFAIVDVSLRRRRLGETLRPNSLEGEPVTRFPAYWELVDNQSAWLRRESPDAYGVYRRTTVVSQMANGKAMAVFSASLPHEGRWRLAYYLPLSGMTSNRRDRLGLYDMRVTADGLDVPVEFDAGAGSAGWNDLGTFDLEAGNVQLLVSDQSTGSVVLADAIRWTPERAE
ncbi:MAG: hypothetical protein OXH15_14140 [Gammaproteobacteria bacterium]|nr:hypothetical protein [Gammaproteobacteria bacterium]